jgi:hypothetical protein
MREGAVAYVVQEGCSAHKQAVVLVQAEVIGEQRGHMIGSQAMLETGVVGPGIDEICQAQLLDPAEPLHLRGIGNLQGQALQLDVSVHRISDLCHQRSLFKF